MNNKIRITKLNYEVAKTISLSENYENNSKSLEQYSELSEKPEHIELTNNTFLSNCKKCCFYKAEYFNQITGALCERCYAWFTDRGVIPIKR